ncbi:MAG: S-layer family protein [Symploca sp. SIO1C4]|uniref:S-layer family protein n=1 Tax=Symploca sp. SIO1C4 TaxID=2607765 RepID=A0A6B3ND29_9CYAN|nr:S-layer family protein [Symploca sp. SIO1C4]
MYINRRSKSSSKVGINVKTDKKVNCLPILVSFFSIAGVFSPTIFDCGNHVLAQIIPDQTLDNNPSTITPNVNIKGSTTDLIDGGVSRGNNLFHSFQEFNVGELQRVFFANPTGINNILTRVTGNKISNILGTLGVDGSANLFLLNPNGIVFGKNARLDITGSFVGSTASSLMFGDGLEFSAINPQDPPLLMINVPIGLQFFGNSGTIQVEGNGQGLRNRDDPVIDTNQALRVQPNQTLALVGGNLLLDGATLKSAGGRIELGSVFGSGQVSLNNIENGFSLGYEDVTEFGDIQLSKATAVDASGESGGEIVVKGRQVRLEGGSQIEVTTLDTAPGGKLQVFASELLEIIGSTADNPQDNRRNPSSLAVDNREDGLIPGELTIDTKRLIVRNGARISASNLRGGVGGNIIVNASDSVELTGTGISSGGQRSSGLSVQTRGDGSAGNLTINTKHLLIQNGAEASASTFAAGGGGKVEVNARESVTLIGTSANGQLRSRLVAEVGDPREIRRRRDSEPVVPATGKGGDLLLTTKFLKIRDGATVTVSSRSDARDAQGAGDIEITAQEIELDNGGRITAETLSNRGGNIIISLQELLLLRSQSQISTSAGTAQNGGDGGKILIDINDGFIVALQGKNSDITANAFSGSGGEVIINATGIFNIAPLTRDELVNLLGTNDSTQLNPNQLSTNDITAISQQSPNLSQEPAINTPDIDPERGLIELPSNLVDASQQIAQGCTPRGRQNASSFIATGRGGLPLSPNEPLRGHSVITNWVDLPPSTTEFNTVETEGGNSWHRNWQPNSTGSQYNRQWDSIPNSNWSEEYRSIFELNVPLYPSPLLPILLQPKVDQLPTAEITQSANQIVEATGWIFGANGDILLIAQSSQNTFVPSPISCSY